MCGIAKEKTGETKAVVALENSEGPQESNELDNDDEEDDQPIGSNGLYTAVLMSALFIACCMLEAPTESAYRFHKSVMAPFENTYGT